MRTDHEELILRNSALTARACWTLSRACADGGDGSPALLPHFVIAGGILFHQATVAKISKMHFESGLLKAITDQPEMLAGLQGRMEENVSTIIVGLQVAAAAGLLLREATPRGPSFRALGTTLPIEIRELHGQGGDILAASRRLGRWFSDDPLEVIAYRLRVEF